MNLTSQQIDGFEEQGYLFFPNCFAEEEVALLRSEAEKIFRSSRPEVWREKNGAPPHPFRPAYLQQTFPPDGPPPAPGRAAAAILRRGRLRPSIQDQRQGGVR